MDIEKREVKLLINKTNEITVELFLYEEMPDYEGMVLLEICVNGEKIRCSSDNFFGALIELRKCLEKENIQIVCNGSARNVFPSPMQFSMGNTRKAYKTYLGQQAKMLDMIDIFDYEDGLEFVDVNEQLKFNQEWIKN